jgi:hypothetical protein
MIRARSPERSGEHDGVTGWLETHNDSPEMFKGQMRHNSVKMRAADRHIGPPTKARGYRILVSLIVLEFIRENQDG